MPTVPAAGYPTGPEAPPAVPLTVPVDDFLRVDARPEAFGGAVGTALSRASDVLERGAGELAQAAISRQDFFNKVASDDANTEFMKESHKLFYGDPDAGVNPVTGQANKPGFFALKGKDAIDAGPPNDALDKLQRDIAARLPNERSRLDFNTETRRLRTYQDGEISRHWDEQLKAAGDQTLAAKGDLHERDAATYFNDPVRFAQILEDGRNDITKRAQIGAGMNADPAILDDARAKEDARLYGSAVRAAIAAGNTERADQLNKEALARGIWNGQQAEEANRLIQEKRDSNLAAGAANRALHPGGGGGGGGGAGGPQPSQPSASKNLENFNFGNMKAVGGGWRTFASEEEGVQAIGDWLVRHNQGGQTTIRQLIDDPQRGYAPSADPGNAGKGLSEAAARIVGVGPDQPVDMRDPALRRKMVGAIVQQEFANPQTTQRALAAYDRAQSGTAPPTTQSVPGASIPPQATVFPSNGTVEVYGDSLGNGLADTMKAGGRTRSGAPTDEILADIKSAPASSYAGKTIVLSSGSNGSHSAGNPWASELRETIQYLKDANANVVLVGYGTKGQLPQRNAELHQIAGEFKVPIVNAEQLGGDGVHPTGAGYKAMQAKIESLHTQLSASTPTPQIIPEGHIAYGPNGQQMKNVGGKLVDVTPRTPPPEM